MMNFIKSSFLSAFFLCIVANLHAQTTPSGAGTLANPYRITVVGNLVWMAQQSAASTAGKYYVQVNNIDANSVSNFTPIGSTSTALAFQGNYDGQNYTISNLRITRSTGSFLAMFGFLHNATVKNVKVNGATFNVATPDSWSLMAVIAGQTNSSTISNCHVTGVNFVRGTLAVGGIVGQNHLTTIENCSVAGTINGTTYVGGIAGSNTGTIRNCFSTANVNGTSNVGGIAGNMTQATAKILNCYNTGRIAGTSYVGGVLGFSNTTTQEIKNSYSVGQISGSSNTGAFAGTSSVTQANCFYNNTVTGAATNIGTAVGKNTADLQKAGTFLEATWDFVCETTNGVEDIWKIRSDLNNGYPVLAWQTELISDNCNQWEGNNSTAWEVASNWSLNKVPADGDNIIISATAIRNLHLDQTRKAFEILFQGANMSVALGNNMLTVTQIRNADANNHIITNGNGVLYKTIAANLSFTFPVANGSYTPVTITNRNSAADVFGVRMGVGVLKGGTGGEAMAGNYINRTWNIYKNNANTGNGVNLAFNWNASDVKGLFTTPALYHYGSTANGIAWEKQTGIPTFTSTSMTYAGYKGTFSPFAVVDATVTLPVAWGSITAVKEQNHALIKWTTHTEENTAFYLVQHSTNGSDWTTVGKVVAAGNINVTKSYQYLHAQPSKGTNYYRLLQQDADNRQEYSKVVTLQWNAENENILVYPNPATGGKLQVSVAQAGTLQVFNNTGILVKQVTVKAGVNAVDVSMLPKGVYRLKAWETSASLLIK